MPVVSLIADGVVSISKFVATFSPILKPLAIAYGIFKGIQLTTIGIGNMMERITKFSKLTRTLKMQELKASFGIDKITKSIAIMRQRGFVKAKAAYLLQRLGLLTDKQAVFFKNRIAYFKNREAGLSKVALNYEKGSLLTSIKITAQKRLQALFGKDSYFQQIKQNVAEKAGNALKFIGLQFTKQGYIYRGLSFLREQAINGLRAVGNALGLTSLSTTVAQGAAETVITANKQTQTRLMPGIIAKGLTYLGTLVAQAAAAIASASALTLGIGTVAILAAIAAGVAYLYSISKPKKAGDMIMADGKTQVSPAEGGLFELSSNDQFVAAPGIADAVTGRNRSQRREERQQRREQRREERQNDNAKLEQSMNRTNQILAVVANNLKPKPLLGSESGQAINNGSYALN